MTDSENIHDVKTILLADDTLADRMAGEAILVNAGYKVITAKDGKEALDIFIAQQKVVALLIVDFRMPKINGPELLLEIRALSKDVPLILLSGYDRADLNAMGVKLSDDISLMSKPIKIDELLKIVHSKIT